MFAIMLILGLFSAFYSRLNLINPTKTVPYALWLNDLQIAYRESQLCLT